MQGRAGGNDATAGPQLQRNPRSKPGQYIEERRHGGAQRAKSPHPDSNPGGAFFIYKAFRGTVHPTSKGHAGRFARPAAATP